MSFPRYPAYKDSGVEWLGEVPAHWEVVRLGQVSLLNPAKREVQSLPRDTGVSFLPMQAIGEDGSLDLTAVKTLEEVETGYTFFRDNDVILAKITPCFENGKGAVARGLLNGIGFGTTELIVVRTDTARINADYLHLFFHSRLFRSRGEAEMYGAGGQKRVPEAYVANFPLPLPPLPEQTAIAQFLDRETAELDALVADQERLIALLKEKRQAVISHAVTRGLNPDAPRKDSGVEWLGDVPAHWEVVRLKRQTRHLEQGWSPQCENTPADFEKEWGVLKVGCVNGGRFSPNENKLLPTDLAPERALSLIAGDLLISRANTRELVGGAAVVDRDYPNLMISDKLYRLRLYSSLNPEYAARYLVCDTARSRIELEATGASASMVNIAQSTITELFVPLPPVSEQTAIVEYLDRETAKLDGLVAEAEHAIALLRERRSALISAAVTGQIDVRGRAT